MPVIIFLFCYFVAKNIALAGVKVCMKETLAILS